MIDFIAKHAAIIGLLFFFLFFIAVIISLYLPGNKKKFEDYKNIPLKEHDL